LLAAGGTGHGKGGSVAMKLMQSMGWSEGEGLGKERQGMATPIILQKTDKQAGIIVNAEPLNKPAAVRLLM
jgi:splicing factor 45